MGGGAPEGDEALRDANGWDVGTSASDAATSAKAFKARVRARAAAAQRRLEGPVPVRGVDRHGEESPGGAGAYLGQLQRLTLLGAHDLEPSALSALALLGLPRIEELDLAGLRGGGRRHRKDLGKLLAEAAPRLESLSLTDMVVDDALVKPPADVLGNKTTKKKTKKNIFSNKQMTHKRNDKNNSLFCLVGKDPRRGVRCSLHHARWSLQPG